MCNSCSVASAQCFRQGNGWPGSHYRSRRFLNIVFNPPYLDLWLVITASDKNIRCPGVAVLRAPDRACVDEELAAIVAVPGVMGVPKRENIIVLVSGEPQVGALVSVAGKILVVTVSTVKA